MGLTMNIQNFKHAVRSADSVVIYGAGKMARQVAACLKHLEPSCLPFCFAVTIGSEATVDGVAVIPVDRIPGLRLT